MKVKKLKESLGILVVIAAILLYGMARNPKKEVKTLGKEKEPLALLDQDPQKEEEKPKREMNGREGMVHLTGSVKEPGVYPILSGKSRLFEVVEQAGGLLPDADEKKINLSSILEDEMHIVIPSVHDSKSDLPLEKEETTGLIDLNLADKKTLMDLPGIGEVKAEAIMAYRKEKPFQKVEELREVPGIGPKLYERLEKEITVEGSGKK